jgi:hypothetical protein
MKFKKKDKRHNCRFGLIPMALTQFKFFVPPQGYQNPGSDPVASHEHNFTQ